MIRTSIAVIALVPSLAIGAPVCWEADGGHEEFGTTVTETQVLFYEGYCSLPAGSEFDGSPITADCWQEGDTERRLISLKPTPDGLLYVDGEDQTFLRACEPRV